MTKNSHLGERRDERVLEVARDQHVVGGDARLDITAAAAAAPSRIP
jgi:hypothetical protein